VRLCTAESSWLGGLRLCTKQVELCTLHLAAQQVWEFCWSTLDFLRDENFSYFVAGESSRSGFLRE
jgi:hypothetical protein